MKITRRAIERIKRLRDRAGVPKTYSVRLKQRGVNVGLQWDPRDGSELDFKMARHGLTVLVDLDTYLRLADYALDCDAQSGGFSLLSLGTRKTKASPQGGSKNGSKK